MANLATQVVNRAGLAPSYAACTAGGDTFTPDAQTFLHVKNASGGALTVTVAIGSGAAAPIPNVAIGNVAVSVPATTGDRMIGPFPATYFADPTTGLAAITYSGVTSLTIAVVKVSAP